MEVKLKDFIKAGEIVSFVHFNGSFKKLKNNDQISYVLDEVKFSKMNIKQYFEKNIEMFSESKFQDACKMALLNPNIINKSWNEVSKTENKRLQLVEALLRHSKTIVFHNFEKGFYEKDCSYYQKLFLKLTKYKKCILCFTDNVSFLFGMVSKFILFRENDYIWIYNFYEDEIYRYVEMPPLISYVNYLNKKGIKMQPYIETKEILKAIYRSVSSGEKQ